jgi:hypothetical protein
VQERHDLIEDGVKVHPLLLRIDYHQPPEPPLSPPDAA